jgi:ribose transport system permease protein
MVERIRRFIPLSGLVILFLIFVFTTDGNFLKWNNIKSLVMQSAIVLVAAVGTVYVMAHNNLDFSLGGACALSSVLAYLVSGGALIPFFILCIVFGVLAGLLSALIHIKGRVPALMAGLAIMFAGRGLAQSVNAKQSMFMVPAIALNDIWIILGIVAVVFIAGFILFNYTQLGKYQKLIGANPRAAALSGINVDKFKTLAFVVSGVTLGIAACLTTIRSAGVNGSTGLNLEIDVLLALSLGGISMAGGSATRIRSAIIGVSIYFILNNGLTLWGLDADYVDIAKAVFFLLTVAVSIDRSQYDLIA